MKIPLVTLENVTVARGGKPVLKDVSFTAFARERIFISGENGAGKSSLLMLLAGKLHPYNNAGRRSYAWDNATGEGFREARKFTALVSREEQLRLQGIHAGSTVSEFLTGHLDGQDFLYRQSTPAESERIATLICKFSLESIQERKLRTLSLGEMRLCLIAKADLHPRKLYLFDEIFSSLSASVAARVTGWIRRLGPDAAIVMTGHDPDRVGEISYTDRYIVSDGEIRLSKGTFSNEIPLALTQAQTNEPGHILIESRSADYYHDFTRIFEDLSFTLRAGDRVLLTGPNGSGKTTLLRIMHGDFYPAWRMDAPGSTEPRMAVRRPWDSGTLTFSHELFHEQKSQLWSKVQFIAAAHFSYYPVDMKVREVLSSRYSGSIYDYPPELPVTSALTISNFALGDFLERKFIDLSEGEKTRVLLARAFLKSAPVYLIDEGFIALSARYFAAAVNYLNTLPVSATIVIAANERLNELKRHLNFALADWRLSDGQLTTHP